MVGKIWGIAPQPPYFRLVKNIIIAAKCASKVGGAGGFEGTRNGRRSPRLGWFYVDSPRLRVCILFYCLEPRMRKRNDILLFTRAICSLILCPLQLHRHSVFLGKVSVQINQEKPTPMHFSHADFHAERCALPLVEKTQKYPTEAEEAVTYKNQPEWKIAKGNPKNP